MKKEQQLDLYYQMVLIRRVEERGAELYQAGKIGGFMHLYIGQEAVSTGLIAAREPRDRVITAYRDHGVALNCGMTADEVMAELDVQRRADLLMYVGESEQVLFTTTDMNLFTPGFVEKAEVWKVGSGRVEK